MDQNRLDQQTSPYLLQHADNPVHWQPWDEAALQQAKAENKPILLSIGYSACHWCHVMAHESFEDAETAELMNRLYVNIKVDREERPDLDKIYQLAHTALTRRSGGWPLTMFLTPDQTPFFGGTYFPKQPRYGMPAFRDILRQVAAYLERHADEIARQNQSLLDFFASLNRPHADEMPATNALLQNAVDDLLESFDPLHGGFGGAPKFPQAGNLELALRLAAGQTGDAGDRLTQLALHSLKKMAEGGIYDQLGGGFFRYAVDAGWVIPHFEKMLYDNGVLLNLYCDAWRISREPLFETVVTQTIDWLLREMRDDAGGFYAALDADSEGEEGKFYIWTPAELKSLLDEQRYALFASRYGMDRDANFEGHWHLRQCRAPGDIAAELDMHTGNAIELLQQAGATLLSHRNKRIRPQRDDKILVAWNALAIKGLANAGTTFNRSDWIDAAVRAMRFIQQKLWGSDRLLSVYCRGQSSFNAYLDDYAFLLDAALSLLQARWDDDTLRFAGSLADRLIEQFQDPQNGQFYFTAHQHESLIHRPLSYSDDSTPSGAMIASRALRQLGHLLGHNDYLAAADRSLQAALPALQHSTLAHGTALTAIIEAQQPPVQIILRGEPQSMRHWQLQARNQLPPWAIILSIDTNDGPLPPTLAGKPAQSDCTAYICYGARCLPAINELEQFNNELSSAGNT